MTMNLQSMLQTHSASAEHQADVGSGAPQVQEAEYPHPPFPSPAEMC